MSTRQEFHWLDQPTKSFRFLGIQGVPRTNLYQVPAYFIKSLGQDSEFFQIAVICVLDKLHFSHNL